MRYYHCSVIKGSSRDKVITEPRSTEAKSLYCAQKSGSLNSEAHLGDATDTRSRTGCHCPNPRRPKPGN